MAKPKGGSSSSSPPPTSAPDDNIGRCSFVGDNAIRCPFDGTMFQHGSRGYCLWHNQILDNPRAHIFDEFERWCILLTGPTDLAASDAWSLNGLVKSRSCCIWTHYSPRALWDRMHGIRDGLPAPAPCENPSCEYRPVLATEREVKELRDRLRLGSWPAAVGKQMVLTATPPPVSEDERIEHDKKIGQELLRFREAQPPDDVPF
jgi:hypothetical protein